MSANQETMRATIAAAAKTKVNSVITAANSFQSTIQASGILVGYVPGFPTGNATFVAAIATANTQKANDLFAAESARQAAVFIAKDLLRSQGEIPF